MYTGIQRLCMFYNLIPDSWFLIPDSWFLIPDSYEIKSFQSVPITLHMIIKDINWIPNQVGNEEIKFKTNLYYSELR